MSPLLNNERDLRPEFTMSQTSAFGELHGLAESQVRIGKRQATCGGRGVFLQRVATVSQRNCNTGGAEQFQISIKTAHIQAQAPGHARAGLRPGSQKPQQAIKPLGPLRTRSIR